MASSARAATAAVGATSSRARRGRRRSSSARRSRRSRAVETSPATAASRPPRRRVSIRMHRPRPQPASSPSSSQRVPTSRRREAVVDEQQLGARRAQQRGRVLGRVGREPVLEHGAAPSGSQPRCAASTRDRAPVRDGRSRRAATGAGRGSRRTARGTRRASPGGARRIPCAWWSTSGTALSTSRSGPAARMPRPPRSRPSHSERRTARYDSASTGPSAPSRSCVGGERVERLLLRRRQADDPARARARPRRSSPGRPRPARAARARARARRARRRSGRRARGTGCSSRRTPSARRSSTPPPAPRNTDGDAHRRLAVVVAPADERAGPVLRDDAGGTS